ncbi:hypothetical protein TWF102_007033 [Orbilia oligospora]|uniref:Uracil-DNA glycosylase-like domain-containing protein n=1 Tax=Orbilia oligospora TaxID=2813651 RepID=A0A7C8NVS0_ORBOL|nr:hypothetical protein TWF103_005906 [Orbilia oligospora]KAF3111362.1 hypothetical protein TWF102_007033 [Orbilia oligospora]KAF3137092.1 hypothetical protein TWF594_007605 [Orbilia oligospora]
MEESSPYQVSYLDSTYRLRELEDLIPCSLFSKVKNYLLQKPCPHRRSYYDSFQIFAVKEIELSGLPIAHLVRGSGAFDGTARLGIFGNYPTFRSDYLEAGECADPTNPCMRILPRKGLLPGTHGINMWDRWHQRESTALRRFLERDQDLWRGAPENVQALHRQFAVDSLILSNPKVVLAVGAAAQKWIHEQETNIKSFLVKGARVGIHIDDHDSMPIKRIVIGCPHPETMFFPKANLYGKLMDEAINFAVGLAGLTALPIPKDYFTIKGENMELRRRYNESPWTLTGQESRVILIARMRNFEKETTSAIQFRDISDLILGAYAIKKGIKCTEEEIQSTLEPGQTLCGAILRSYASANHKIMEERGWPNLKGGTRVQAAGGWKSLKKAAMNLKEATAVKRTMRLREQWRESQSEDIKRKNVQYVV